MYTAASPVESWAGRHYTISASSVETVTGPGLSLFGAAVASVAWPLANLAIYIPFQITETLTVYEAGVGAGATAGGNFDIGIYDSAGTRLVSSGSTARTLSAWNTAGLTDTTLTPGIYFMAMSADGTNNYSGWAPAAGICESLGVNEQTTAFVLPSTATFARTTRAFIPNINLAVRSVAL